MKSGQAFSIRGHRKGIVRASSNRRQRSIQSVETGFRLIHALEQAIAPLSLSELAASAGIPASNAHLYLVSFRNVGLVTQQASGRYTLGSYAVQLGLSAIARLDIVSISLGPMQELRDKTGEATYLSLWGNRGPCIVSKIDGSRQIPMSIKVGYVLPLLDTATGRIFMAHLPNSTAAPILREERLSRAEPGHTGQDSVAQIIEEVRARGMARTDGRLNQGFVALAAPLFDHSGTIAASLALLGPSAIFNAGFRSANAKLLAATAAGISKSLGFSPRHSAKQERE